MVVNNVFFSAIGGLLARFQTSIWLKVLWLSPAIVAVNIIYMYSVANATNHRVSLVTISIISVFIGMISSALIGALALQQGINTWKIIGMALVLVGVFVSQI